MEVIQSQLEAIAAVQKPENGAPHPPLPNPQHLLLQGNAKLQLQQQQHPPLPLVDVRKGTRPPSMLLRQSSAALVAPQPS